MNNARRTVTCGDEPYPLGQIYEARANFISSFCNGSNKAMCALKNKCDLEPNNDSSSLHSQPFIVDFNQQVSNSQSVVNKMTQHTKSGAKNSTVACNKPDLDLLVPSHAIAEQNIGYSEHPEVAEFQSEDTNDLTQTLEHREGSLNDQRELKIQNNQSITIDDHFETVHDQTNFNSNLLQRSSENNPNHEENLGVNFMYNERSKNTKLVKLNHKDNRNVNCGLYHVDNRKYNIRRSIEEQQSAVCDVDETGPTPTKVSKLVQTNGLLCDHCSFSSLECSEMKMHLKTKLHYSASLTEGVYRNNKFKPSCIVKESYLLNVDGKYKEIIPICPKCDNIFPTVHMCALHYAIHHDRYVKNTYSTAKVVGETVVLIPVQNYVCKICNTNNVSHTGLIHHWLSNGHSPYQSPKVNSIVYFICEYCVSDRPFYKFADAVKHVLGSHIKQHISGEVYLRARYLRRVEEAELYVLPRAQMPVRQQIEGDLKNLNLMIQPCNRCDTEKQNKVTKNFIRQLRTEISCFHN